MCPFIAHPAIVAAAANAPLVVTGLIASPSAHRIAMKNLVTA